MPKLALPKLAVSKLSLPVPALALMSLALLAGCAATGPNTVAPIPATAEAVSPLCPAWVTPCVGAPAGPVVGDVGDLPRLVQTADELLFAGDEKGAWQQLNAALKIDPKHRPALLLMSQISDDPRKLLGDMSEPYTVGKSESLRQIAAARLGDARLFYALARYNNIAVPRQLEAGRSILLPLAATGAGPLKAAAGKRGAASGADAAAASGNSAASTPAARAAAAIPAAPPAMPQASTNTPGSAATQVDTAPRAGTGSAVTTGGAIRAPAPTPPLTDAATTGTGALARTPGTSAPAASGGDAELAFRRAAAAEKAGKAEQAYAGFMRALALGHPGAADRASALRQDLIAQQKRVARTALERQNFDIAIKALRNVLELDPGDVAAGDELRKVQRRRDASTGQRRAAPG
jgi:tetratricopeptide (TPR) repeat protein